MFFFFQAEDGIRDLTVTGVQTCALPIYGNSTVPWYRRKRVSSVERWGEAGHDWVLPMAVPPSTAPSVATGPRSPGRSGAAGRLNENAAPGPWIGSAHHRTASASRIHPGVAN